LRLIRVFAKTFARLEDTLLVALLASLIGLGAFQIGMRNFGGSAPAWIDELVRIIVLWLAMTGAMTASRFANHITIDLVSRLAPPRARHAIAILASLFTVCVCALLAYYCFEFVKIEYEFGSKVLKGVAAWTVQAILPVGFAVIALRYLCLAVEEVRALVTGVEREALAEHENSGVGS
jgi:TRAP-type C4-dicarboxylate transport system permease small subunit